MTELEAYFGPLKLERYMRIEDEYGNLTMT